MRAVLLSVPEGLLEERRRLGLDGRDEMWGGVVHMVPPANDAQQGVQAELFPILAAAAKRLGMVPRFETGLFRDASDFKVPDQLFCRPDQRSARGAEGAELVVEVRSPDDETDDKIGWYAALGVRELLIVHPAGRVFELFRQDRGALVPVPAATDGAVTSDVLEVRLRTTDGVLQLSWAGGSAAV